ncbi:MAG: hypothetical protein ABIM89_07905 [Mycobacteriales bacterium]
MIHADAGAPRSRWHTLTSDRRRVITVGLLVLVIVWAVLPWQWSLVDDAGYRLALKQAAQQNGWWDAVTGRISAVYADDRAGGQFRPVLWLYAGLFYSLPSGLAHALRLVMVIVAVGGVGLVVSRRRGSTGSTVALVAWALLVVASVRGLYDGLSFLSVMELPAISFAVAGVFDRNEKRRLVWLSIAAWCKTPVVTALLAYVLILLWRRRWLLGGLGGVIAIATVLAARSFALRGAYTARYSLTCENAVQTVSGFAKQSALPGVAVFAGLVWLVLVRFWPSEESLVLGGGGLGYLVLMLPWGSGTGYNMAPPAFLGAAAVVVAIADSRIAPNPGRRRSLVDRRPQVVALPLVIATLTAAVGGGIGLKAAFDRDATIRGVVEFAADRYTGQTIATNGLESAPRFAELLQLKTGEDWSTRFVWGQPGTQLCGSRYLVGLDDQGPVSVSNPLKTVKRMPKGAIYDLGNTLPCAPPPGPGEPRPGPGEPGGPILAGPSSGATPSGSTSGSPGKGSTSGSPGKGTTSAGTPIKGNGVGPSPKPGDPTPARSPGATAGPLTEPEVVTEPAKAAPVVLAAEQKSRC